MVVVILAVLDVQVPLLLEAAIRLDSLQVAGVTSLLCQLGRLGGAHTNIEGSAGLTSNILRTPEQPLKMN